MIGWPKNWQKFGNEVTIDDIDSAMRVVIADIDCINLSFSGGVDSSLLLYYLLEVKGKANCFTVANDAGHPDIEYSAKAIQWLKEKCNTNIDHMVFIRPNLEGDSLVKTYYGALKPFVGDIITGDCIDELSCGYYNHRDLQEETYHNYLHRVQVDHLQPLNENSGDTLVYLPYADDRVANLFYRIPLYEKVSQVERKLIIMRLAEGKVSPEVIERRKYGLGSSVAKIAV